MTAIQLSGVIDSNVRLRVALPGDLPVRRLQLILRFPHAQPVQSERERHIRVQLAAAGILSDYGDPPAAPLDEELLVEADILQYNHTNLAGLFSVGAGLRSAYIRHFQFACA